MRRFAAALFVLVLAAAPSVRAQSGRGGLRGAVLPRPPHGLSGSWDAALTRILPPALRSLQEAIDTTTVGRVTLTLLGADGTPQMCEEGPANCRRPPVLVAPMRGLYGRYAFPRVYMGQYQMRIEADGCTPIERTVLILSDSESVDHALLTCTLDR